ncbi:unnamed protein product [Euphydryas editha]|uniref:Uncharacterized protein n=1 Tax=Euphydryas editha TaxID=104508 RepID=A0AAU9TJV7_EUPED|nr:unnamed protein product [Euphydryas editha]
MKLISLIILLGTVRSQNVQREQFSFSPQFQTPSSAFFSSDSSIYLPPESHTPIPYYTLNNVNKLPFQYFPSSATKTPAIFSTPFPIVMSSTFNSNIEDEGNTVELNKINNRRFLTLKPIQRNFHNTSVSKEALEKRDAKIKSQITNIQTPFEKFDIKQSNYASGNKAPAQTSAARRMIVTSEIQRTEVAPDQTKASPFQNSQYIQAPGAFITSTAEPSIPILRLSNEMDLDGSFSYEALGADQTHYVQHSRMENMGTDKEEQVVEGSYSYVGDDGRTYTVHYVADSNGYRATGDHLPVPPPVPEIIQRSVQYNLAEEAKRPPHLKSSWENEDTEYENREESRNRIFNIPPPRNLFTGKTPEAFSFGFSQATNSQNNLATASSYQVPTKTSFEIVMDQSKPKHNVTPISPQITFLASQGAHNPSQQPQSSPTKLINSEKSSLPLLMNYEADITEPEQDASKGMWRWQYGLNTNTNQTPNKNSISRSSSESGDDIVINFNDMTSDQYTRMIQSQVFGENMHESNKIERHNEEQLSTPFNRNIETYNTNSINKPQQQYTENEKYQAFTSTENNDLYSEQTNKLKYTDSYSKIISSHNFIPQNQIVTQSYNVDVTKQEPTERSTIEENTTENLKTVNKVEYSNDNYFLSDNIQEETASTNPFVYNFKDSKPSELNYYENNGFKPAPYNNGNELLKYETTTTEVPMKEVIKDNIFLRNLFKSENIEENSNELNVEDKNKQMNITLELKQDKIPKYIPFQEKPQNEIKMMQSKPLDINDVLNYVVMKNHFESIKTKPKNKPVNNFNQITKIKDHSVHFIPIKENNLEREKNQKEQESDYRVLNSQQQQELHGLIKNYKVLQRHKNIGQQSQPLMEPQRHIKAFHTQGLPPLGRAGPSMKSYLPPTYL